MPDGARSSWLVVGHGSVGAFLAGRLARGGVDVFVFDPSPRLPVVAGTPVATLSDGSFDNAVSCVSPEAAEDVAPLASAAVAEGGLLFDWNTIAPAAKRRLAAAAGGRVVDVALLDSIDAAPDRPTLAVSGPAADRGAVILTGFGFRVAVAGAEVGDAAALKYLRSIFMKTLEALTLEFGSLASELDDEGIVRSSIEANLGPRFAAFMDVLIATNRIHAERRSGELADAVASFAEDGLRPELAEAAVSVLRRSADAWEDDGAPPAGSEVAVLSRHLRRALWPEHATT